MLLILYFQYSDKILENLWSPRRLHGMCDGKVCLRSSFLWCSEVITKFWFLTFFCTQKKFILRMLYCYSLSKNITNIKLLSTWLISTFLNRCRQSKKRTLFILYTFKNWHIIKKIARQTFLLKQYNIFDIIVVQCN